MYLAWTSCLSCEWADMALAMTLWPGQWLPNRVFRNWKVKGCILSRPVSIGFTFAMVVAQWQKTCLVIVRSWVRIPPGGGLFSLTTLSVMFPKQVPQGRGNRFITNSANSALPWQHCCPVILKSYIICLRLIGRYLFDRKISSNYGIHVFLFFLFFQTSG